MVNDYSPIRRTFVGKETGIAFVVLLILYGSAYAIPIAPLQLPGYLLMIGFDNIDPFIPSVSEIVYEVIFGLYLYGLAVIIGAISHGVRNYRNGERTTEITFPIAICLVLIGLLAIGIGILPAIAPPTVHSKQCTQSASGGAGSIECTTETYTANPSLNLYALTAGAVLLGGAIGIVMTSQDGYSTLDIVFRQ